MLTAAASEVLSTFRNDALMKLADAVSKGTQATLPAIHVAF